MAENDFRVGWEVFWLAFSIAVFLVALIALATHRWTRHVPGMAHRPVPKARQADLTHPPLMEPKDRPEGYIEAFNKHAEEAEGGIPPLGWVVLIGIPVWWALYLVLYWDRLF